MIDEVTIRYTWPLPNPRFLPALAQARPVYIYRPAQYMKKYHAKYAPAEKLAERVQQAQEAREVAEKEAIALKFVPASALSFSCIGIDVL